MPPSPALLDQFSASLVKPSPDPVPSSSSITSPLPLLSASVSALKIQVTKISLLSITAPLTASAIAGCLAEINDAVLPSLVSAALLITSYETTRGFSDEVNGVVRGLLKDLKGFVGCVEKRSQDLDNRSGKVIGQREKNEITEATGRVWDGCDQLSRLAEDGVVGFVAKKASQWLELMKDAVRELEEWDPEEEVDDIFGDGHLSEDGSADDEAKGGDRATIQAGVKGEALKVLCRIPQSIHVVVKQRLEKVPRAERLGRAVRDAMDSIVGKTRTISECMDDSAEAMYMGDLERCLKKAGEARAVTIEVVEAVLERWDTTAGSEERKEDKYLKRALDWIRQVEPGGAKTVAQKVTDGSHGKDVDR